MKLAADVMPNKILFELSLPTTGNATIPIVRQQNILF